MADSPQLQAISSTYPWGGHVSIPRPGVIYPDRSPPWSSASPLDVGILKSALLPSLSLNSSLAALAYTAGRLTDRLKTKDLIWPVVLVLEAWYAVVFLRDAGGGGRRGVSASSSVVAAWDALSRPEKMLLGGVTLWGASLLYRLAASSLRRGPRRPPLRPRQEAAAPACRRDV